MKLTLAFSPCPNDTFIFYALVNHKIDCGDLQFIVDYQDIENLNRKAFDGEYDISKISFFSYPKISDRYQILNSGGALGYRNGPLVISKRKIYPDELKEAVIAIPGKNTTANLLFSILFPEVNKKKEYLFSDIEEALLSDEVDAGLIIHETRFTFEDKGLNKIADLGELWEKRTQGPVPLGGIVIRREFNQDLKQRINQLIKESLLYAQKNTKECMPYVKKHSQNVNDDIILQHIMLYVNEFSVDFSEVGKKAIKNLYDEASKEGISGPHTLDDIFL
jgi:1,4-dihydroxy-6-naphthoate synthase